MRFKNEIGSQSSSGGLLSFGATHSKKPKCGAKALTALGQIRRRAFDSHWQINRPAHHAFPHCQPTADPIATGLVAISETSSNFRI